MLASPAYAATSSSAPSGAFVGFLNFFPFLLIIVVFYFLLIRPQQQRAKDLQKAITAVKKNDTVVTAGGIIGKVTRVDDNEVELEIASGVRIKVIRATLAEVRSFGTKPAND